MPSEGTYLGHEERVIVLLPKSRDAASIARVLEMVGVASIMCAAYEDLCAEIDRGAGALLIEEDALTPSFGARLSAILDNQPSWSELPVIVLLRHGPETRNARNALLLPGDVTLVERPVHVNTLVAVVRSVLRSRRRQYLVRDQLLALEQSERRYRTLFDSIDEGFCIVKVIFDEDDKPIDYLFLEVNPAFAEQTGLTDAQGKRMRELAPLEQYWIETYGLVALTGQSVRFENWAGPLQRWFDVYAFRSGRPEDRHVAILFSDITGRKLAEDKIEKLNTSLAARSAELEEANRSLEAFNSAVAHDLRNPLNTIGSYFQVIETLCSDKLSEECKGYLAKGYDKVVAMSKLITALLTFSQMAQTEPHLERVDISAMAQKTTLELRQAEPERRVTFRIISDVMANGDPSLLQVVLDNLLGNAWKYTGMLDEAVIEFGVTETDGIATYFVRDNGPGFSMADADKLFVPFRRLPGSEKLQGYGIGLATVERIIHHHGGRIWAEGEPGKGATFYFTLSAV